MQNSAKECHKMQVAARIIAKSRRASDLKAMLKDSQGQSNEWMQF